MSDDFEPFIEQGRPVEHVLEVRLSGTDLANLDRLAEAHGLRVDALITAALRYYANRPFAAAGATLEEFGSRVRPLHRTRQADDTFRASEPWQAAGSLLAGT